MGPGTVVLIQIREGGESVGSGPLRFAAAVHFGIDREGALARVDYLALESDDVTGENRELEVDAVQHEQDGVLGVNILSYGKIGAFQEPLGASPGKESLVVVEVGQLDQTL